MSDHIIVLSRDDTARFMAAVADLEEYADAGGLKHYPKLDEAVSELSRIASLIDGQVEAQ